MRQSKVTIRDVARAAGVSTTTVSDTLTGRGRLTDETRARVATIAEQLGYSANTSAQNLRRGRTGAVGLYFPDHSIALPYFMELAVGAAEETLSHDLALTLIPFMRDENRPVNLALDGVVVSDPMVDDPMCDRIAELGLPMVSVERDLVRRARYAGRVECDQVAGMRAMLQHLADRGARRTALINITECISFAHDLQRAYLDWCAEHKQEPLLQTVPFAHQPEDIRRAAKQLLTSANAPDAIVSVADGGAAVVLHVALEQGLRVPEDLMVAAYTDSPSLQYLSVSVTAVDVVPREAGRAAVKLLADVIAGRVKPGTVRELSAPLIVRQSTNRVTKSRH